MTTIRTKNKELIKIMQAMEALGYQVDSIEMLPSEAFFTSARYGCVINIKASPLIEIPLEDSYSK